MKINKNRNPTNSIKTLSSALQCASLSTFLIIGLNGCSSDNECSNISNLSQKKIEECNDKQNYTGNYNSSSNGSSSHSSGFFAPIGHSKTSHFGG